MDLIVLNENFEAVSVIDAYESVIWTDRYDKPGEFEIYTPVSDQMVTYPKVNNYLRIVDSDHLMVIEDITIEANVEDGNHIKIVGRSLESILDRRVVIGEINLRGSVQNSIKSLINTNIISASDRKRRIENFIFEESTDTAITSLTYEGQFKGKDLLSIIEEICKDQKLGFRLLLKDLYSTVTPEEGDNPYEKGWYEKDGDTYKRTTDRSLEPGKDYYVVSKENVFAFSLYMGTDRSYKQETLPYVVFKPSLDNIINSNYSEEHSGAKTFCYAHSSYTEKDDEGESQKIDVVRTVGSGEGLLRKEIYKEASVTKDEDMSLSQFYKLIEQAGKDELNEKKIKKEFDGECETKRMFVYGRDFFMGDVVQVANEYGMEAPARVTEYIMSQSRSEIKSYPTFTALDYEESEES